MTNFISDKVFIKKTRERKTCKIQHCCNLVQFIYKKFSSCFFFFLFFFFIYEVAGAVRRPSSRRPLLIWAKLVCGTGEGAQVGHWVVSRFCGKP